MNFKLRACPLAVLLLLAVSVCQTTLNAQETIVAIRHAEKAAGGLGQISCRGLNRALALHEILVNRFGTPDAIYAPDPAVGVHDGSKNLYSYVRPLTTIEPTAIALGMAVNAQIGYSDIATLQSVLTAPANAHALIFVAWEHDKLNEFARQILKSYGNDPRLVPDWPMGDYDRIYVFKITRNSGRPELTFKVEHENLDESLGDECPGPAR